MLRITLLFTLAAAIAVGAFALWDLGVRPAGPHTVQTRNAGAFHRVQLHGSTDVHVRPGRSETLTVAGPRERVDDITTDVHDGTLIVGEHNTAHWFDLGDSDIVVTVHSPAVDAVTVDGSGRVSLPPARGGTTRIHIDGSGEVAGTGHVDRLEASVNGSGDADLGGLEARTARAEVSGSGQVAVDAHRELDATVHGSGGVRYSGRPQVHREVDGTGSVTAG
jgi:Putative auto-transporter adhesin, head GIN domain